MSTPMPKVIPRSVPKGDEPARGDAPLTHFSGEPAEVVGKVLDGRYRIERVLGQGAMAVVLGARHAYLQTPVAVKVLHPMLAAVPEMRARFLREGRLGHEVAHPGLVRVSDLGVSAEGLHYLVMEQLAGEDLLAWSERRGPASAEVCSVIARAVLEVLEVLHAAGYVHRDLKPENLWVLEREGGAGVEVKVLDLGIAGLVESAHDERVGRHLRASRARLTRAGETLGTALYMSPEQAMGNPLDGRSDLYALGAVLWEIATAKTAFEGDTPMAIMLEQISVTPPAPSTLNPSLPPWFDSIVMKLLAKKADERFQSAAEVIAALEEGPGACAKAEAGAGAKAAGARRAWIWGVVGMVGMVALVLAAIAVMWPAPAEESATPASARAVRAMKVEIVPGAWLGSDDPTTASEAVAPDEVTIVFSVEPRGARVLRDGALVGVTPLVHRVDASAEQVRYTIEAEGRRAMNVELAHDRDQVVSEVLELARGPGAVRRPAENTRKPPSDGDTMAPSSAPSDPAGDGLWQPERP